MGNGKCFTIAVLHLARVIGNIQKILTEMLPDFNAFSEIVASQRFTMSVEPGAQIPRAETLSGKRYAGFRARPFEASVVDAFAVPLATDFRIEEGELRLDNADQDSTQICPEP